MLPTSLIITTYNEAGSIEPLLDSILGQTKPFTEIVFCDASTDNTPHILQSFADAHPDLHVQIILAPETNISQGRNIAIAAARCDVIAVADAGTVLKADWREQITAPFNMPTVGAVGGWFEPHTTNIFEVALAATTLPRASEIDPEQFAPSSRSVAFRKDAWAAVGGFPEWQPWGEDVVFDHLMLSHLLAKHRDETGQLPDRDRVFPTQFEAIVYFRPRKNIKAFYRQYWRYAYGGGIGGIGTERAVTRYTAYAIGVCLMAGALVMLPWSLVAWVPLLAGAWFYVRTPYRRLAEGWPDLSFREKSIAMVWVPVIRLAGDIAKMCGFIAGQLWRRKNDHRPEIHWRDTLEVDVDLSPGASGLKLRF